MRTLLLVVLILFVSFPAFARDTRLMVSYQEAMNTADAKSKLTGGVRFFFGDQKTPGVARTIGEWVANKKTNATNKTDEEACNWAFLSAMISLEQRALREGGDAVINIHSFYKKIAKKGTQQFECGAGAFVAGVTLKGTVVKLK